MAIKTHTFRLGRYRIEFCYRIDGVCDTPNDDDEDLTMLLLDGSDFKAFNSALHEAMHADGIDDKYLHDKEGYSDTERLAKFMWRWVQEKIVRKG